MWIVNKTIYFEHHHIKQRVFHLQQPSPPRPTKPCFFFFYLPSFKYFRVIPCLPFPSTSSEDDASFGEGGELIPTPHPLIRRQLLTPAKRIGAGGGGLGGGVVELANHIAAATVKGSNSGCGVRAQPA